MVDDFSCKDPTNAWRWNPSASGVKVRRLESVVVKFIEDHPALLYISASEVIAEALEGAFPCPWPSSHPQNPPR